MKKAVAFLMALVLMFALACCSEKTEQGVTSSQKTTKQEVADVKPEKDMIEINGESYELTFFDDFEGDKLNSLKWSLCPEQKRQDVGGYWHDSQTRLDGKGNLVLSADIDENGTPVSGAVRTSWKFKQARGYFEIRCKLQQSKGFWGAFWLMCDEINNVGNGASDGAEIDIFESHDVNGGGINHAIHWDGYGDSHKMISKSVGTDCYDGEFHTFSLLWTDTEYIFYIDGEETYRLSEGDEGFPGSCEVRCYLKITTEFGSWAGKYDKDELPDSIVVDYVKVYQKSE